MSSKGLGFSFKYVIRNKIFKEMQNLDSKKTCQESDIPVKLIKNLDVISPFVYNNYNNSLFSSCFPSELKNANVPKMCLFSKKKDQSDLENYRPVSILPIFSKVYERCVYDQIYEYFNKILSKQQRGFRQGFSTEHDFLALTEKWIKYLDKDGVSGALLTDLSKAFDRLLHLLIAKVAAYGFYYESLTLIKSYLSNLF